MAVWNTGLGARNPDHPGRAPRAALPECRSCRKELWNQLWSSWEAIDLLGWDMDGHTVLYWLIRDRRESGTHLITELRLPLS